MTNIPTWNVGGLNWCCKQIEIKQVVLGKKVSVLCLEDVKVGGSNVGDFVAEIYAYELNSCHLSI